MSERNNWRSAALDAACGAAERGQDSTLETDYAAADAAVEYIFDKFIDPLIQTVEADPNPNPDVVRHVDTLKRLLIG